LLRSSDLVVLWHPTAANSGQMASTADAKSAGDLNNIQAIHWRW